MITSAEDQKILLEDRFTDYEWETVEETPRSVVIKRRSFEGSDLLIAEVGGEKTYPVAAGNSAFAIASGGYDIDGLVVAHGVYVRRKV